MRGYCTEIKSDLYNITGRLKEIDKGYFVVRHRGRFEVHNRLQEGGSFCLAVPYQQLDCRTLNLVRRTRCERAKEFLYEIEEENLRLQSQRLSKAKTMIEQKAEEIFNDN